MGHRIILTIASAAALTWWWIIVGRPTGVPELAGLILVVWLLLIVAEYAVVGGGGLGRSFRPAVDSRTSQLKCCLRRRIGDEEFVAWFNALEVSGFDGATVQVSVPVRFLQEHLQKHYMPLLTMCCLEVFEGSQGVNVVTRSPKANPA